MALQLDNSEFNSDKGVKTILDKLKSQFAAFQDLYHLWRTDDIDIRFVSELKHVY